MSARRPPPTKTLLPDLEPSTNPSVSGEYRIINERKRRSSASMNAVRPEIRRVSSTSLPAVRVAASPITGATPAGPRRYSTVHMEAITPPLTAGRELHELDFDFDIDADGALELGSLPSTQSTRVETPRLPTHGAPPARPSGQTARMTSSGQMARVTSSGQMARVTSSGQMARVSAGAMLPPAPSWPMASSTGRRSSSAMAAVDPHAALVAFSGFGDPPASLFGTPAYALRVIARRRALRRDLKLARLRHSHDVGLYEASLRTADDIAVRNGVLLTAVFFTMMTALAWTVARVLGGTPLVLPW